MYIYTYILRANLVLEVYISSGNVVTIGNEESSSANSHVYPISEAEDFPIKDLEPQNVFHCSGTPLIICFYRGISLAVNNFHEKMHHRFLA